MNNIIFEEEIRELIALDIEGEYWDFKEQWHSPKDDLLHDIICMANNLANRDAYIIIGVKDRKDENGENICGVPTENRKTQANLIDFLKEKKFAGGIRPTVYVSTIRDQAVEIDVIIIKNTMNTPYYLVEPYREVKASAIYTRIGDTNTPKTSCADVDKVAYLWRKRFGIDLTVKERLQLLLDSPDEWEGDLDYDGKKFHSVYPEFQLTLVSSDISDSENSIVKNLAANYSDNNFSMKKIEIKFHSTIIFSNEVIYLDGARILIPLPDNDTIYLDDSPNIDNSLTYLFFDKSTVLGKLFLSLSKGENNWYGQNYNLSPRVSILLFEDASDRDNFEKFAKDKLPEVIEDYKKALSEKGYEDSKENREYFAFGHSKANDIKSHYLYNLYRYGSCKKIIEYLPEPQK